MCWLASVGSRWGMMASPFFPENARFTLVQTLGPLTAGVTQDLDIGGELKPVSFWWFVGSVPVVVLFVAALVVAWRRRWSLGGMAWVFLSFALVTLVGSLRVARFFDYFVMAAVVFAALVLWPVVAGRRRDAVYAFGLLFLFCALNLFLAWKTLAATPDPARWRGASEFLAKQERDALVVNTRWADYYFLYFWNARSRYLIGIDPTFYYLMNKSGYWFWRHASNDEAVTCGQPVCGAAGGPPSRWLTDSPAKFVVLDRERNPRLEGDLRGSGRWREVFREGGVSVFGR